MTPRPVPVAISSSSSFRKDRRCSSHKPCRERGDEKWSESLCSLIYRRSLGRGQQFTRRTAAMLRSRLAAEGPPFMKRRDIQLGEVDKVFTSRWRDNNIILSGTKCNRLLALRLDNGDVDEISLIPPTEERPLIGPCGGIHGMDIDPHRQFLATSGTHENTLNVFDLETLTPRVAFQGAHRNWVFDIRWLSDRRLVSCSRDGTLAVWSMDNYLKNRDRLDEHASKVTDRYFFEEPTIVTAWTSSSDDAVSLRTMTYSHEIDRLCVVSSRKELDVVDVANDRVTSLRTISLQPCCQEAVTAAYNPLNPWETAVGAQAHVFLYDIRTRQISKTLWSKHQTYGVRSLQFNDHMLSYSTGRGSVFFYDVRACRHLDLNSKAFSVGLGKSSIDDRQTGNGSLASSFIAVYTHEYDHSRTRMFCAGGPLSSAEIGSFASLWW